MVAGSRSGRKGVTSQPSVAGRRSQNLGALELPDEVTRRLEEVSRPELVHPYHFFERFFLGMWSGGTDVRAEPPWFRPS